MGASTSGKAQPGKRPFFDHPPELQVKILKELSQSTTLKELALFAGTNQTTFNLVRPLVIHRIEAADETKCRRQRNARWELVVKLLRPHLGEKWNGMGWESSVLQDCYPVCCTFTMDSSWALISATRTSLSTWSN